MHIKLDDNVNAILDEERLYWRKDARWRKDVKLKNGCIFTLPIHFEDV